ncbi:MAG: hypothetical protein Q8Q42_02270 [Nanoarchaeota archaeon]|nr:hypothetical protein [Nanoarchaeota archaeon]
MKKALVLLVSLLLVMMPMVFAEESCSDDNIICDQGEVDQSATIGAGTGSPPSIEYVWVLPDENLNDQGTQLFPTLSSERNDIYACVVVGDPQGRDDISQVFVDVYHPEGTQDLLPCVPDANNKCDFTGDAFDRNPEGGLFKYQVHADRLNPTIPADMQFIEDCKLDALAAGLITQADVDLINYNIFSQPEWYMYTVNLPMLYHQPSGLYEVKAWATDHASAFSDMVSSFFDWVSTVALEIDFQDGLDYGALQPSVYRVIQGDYNMISGDGKPTVKNEGNERVEISVQSSTLLGDTFNKEINDFDVKWDPYETGFGHGQVFFDNDEQVILEDPLELCQTEKIDFSAHADLGLPADNYHGILQISTSAHDE